MTRQQDQQQSKVFYELSSLILNILRSPPLSTIDFSDNDPINVSSAAGGSSSTAAVDTDTEMQRQRRIENANMQQQITPMGFASLLLGISVVLMLSGSLTFFIGFMLMPWVIGLSLVFCLVGFVSSLSTIGRSILYPTS